jgi:hypothetical protein
MQHPPIFIGSSGKQVPHRVKVFSAIPASSAVRLKFHRRAAETAEKRRIHQNKGEKDRI